MRKPFFDPPIIAIDFDGTIAENAYPELGDIKEEAKEFINFLKDEGIRVVIWTCRTNEEEVKEHLIKNGVHFDAFNNNDAITNEEFEEYGFEDSRKIGADYVIDDRAIRFEDNWDEIHTNFKNAIKIWRKNECQKE
ncbi:MAG: hydrolase [Nanoarchaeota archaeon]